MRRDGARGRGALKHNSWARIKTGNNSKPNKKDKAKEKLLFDSLLSERRGGSRKDRNRDVCQALYDS